MRIIHVITGMQKAAGTSVFCGEVANGLVAAGHEVTIAVVNPLCSDCYPLDPRVKLVSISSILNTSHYALTNKPSTLRTNHCALIHIHALWSPVLHKIAKWARLQKLPVVWSPHGMLTPWAMNNKKWKKLLGWWLYQRWDLATAALIHATAESELEDIRRMGLKNNVVVAPLGVRISSRVTSFAKASAAREHIGRVERKKVLLFVSRVQRKKGLVNLARAWADLPKSLRAGWKVRIVGPDQENHTAELQSLCEELGILQDFEFVGPKYGDELHHEYTSANLFVLPTHSENFGSVVIEALACGVPVITTKGTPWQELCVRECGWWIDVGDEPLSVALREAMSLPDATLREMGGRGLRLVEEKYTWEAVRKKMVAGYVQVLTGTNENL